MKLHVPLCIGKAILLAISYICFSVSGYDYAEESVDGKGTPEISHSLMAPYLHGEFDNEWWEFGGKI